MSITVAYWLTLGWKTDWNFENFLVAFSDCVWEQLSSQLPLQLSDIEINDSFFIVAIPCSRQWTFFNRVLNRSWLWFHAVHSFTSFCLPVRVLTQKQWIPILFLHHNNNLSQLYLQVSIILGLTMHFEQLDNFLIKLFDSLANEQTVVTGDLYFYCNVRKHLSSSEYNSVCLLRLIFSWGSSVCRRLNIVYLH